MGGIIMFNVKTIAAAAINGIEAAKENKAVRIAAGLALNGAVAAAQIKYGIPAVLAANAASRTLMRPDASVQGMVFARALDWCQGTPDDKIRRLEEACRAVSPAEECAALREERLGKIGAYVRGEVVAAFATDVGSLHVKGHKVALGMTDLTSLRSLVRTASDFKAKKRATSTPWSEVWLRPRSIEGLWVARSLVEEYPYLLDKLRDKGYPVEVVPDEAILTDNPM